jgi:hypothetical protein
MRVSGCAAKLLLVLALASPALLHAQFQEPTPEELKMTADPKAPGADAIYLDYEMTSDTPAHSSSYYVRIKVLAEKGKELATVSIPYEPKVDWLKEIQGRTIHSDGTVIPLIAKPEDLVEIKTKGFQENTLVFTLPNVEVGSILEFRVKLHRDEDWGFLPTWQIQRPYFVHKAHYSFRPGSFQHLLYSINITSGDKVVQDKKNVFTLDIADVPPEPSDDWMPPMNTLSWRVEFYSSQYSSGSLFWTEMGISWAEWVQDFTKPTTPIKNAVAGVVAPDDSEKIKAEKIYAAVMKLENTAFTRQKSKAERKKEKLKDIKKAEDIWKQQAGTEDEIALLYIALARAADLKAWPILLVNRNRAIFDKTYLSNQQFDDYVVVVQLDGKDVYLDPGQKMCPFGSLSWKHSLASGVRFSEKEAAFATTPAISYKASVVTRVARLAIDAEGGVKGTVRFGMTGPEALYWRQLALENDDVEVKKQFNESMQAYLPDGVQADFDHFLALDDPTVDLIGFVNVSGSLGSVTGKRMILPALFLETRAKHPFIAQDKRTIPIDAHFPRMDQDEVTYELPPGFTVEGLPPDADNAWPSFAVFKIRSSKGDGTVTVRRTLAYNFTLLDPSVYSNLHDFFLKVAAADQQPLVLTRTPVVKGN